MNRQMYMNGHVEVVAFELVRHFSKLLERVLSLGLLEAKSFHGLGNFFRDALWTAPIAFGYFRQRRHQAKCVVTVVAPIAEQHALLVIATGAIATNVFRQLEGIIKSLVSTYGFFTRSVFSLQPTGSNS